MRWGLGFGREKKREWLGVCGVQIEGLCRGKVLPSFFFLFSLYSLRAVFIVGTSGTPLVGKPHRWFPLLIARDRFKGSAAGALYGFAL